LLLIDPVYFYVLPDRDGRSRGFKSTDKCPLCASFAHWAFPHAKLPSIRPPGEFHQRVLSISDGVAPEMLLARFVLAILSRVREFLRDSRRLDI
jgi:hypothetical protein